MGDPGASLNVDRRCSEANMSPPQPHAPPVQADVVARLVYAVASWDECVSLVGGASAGTAAVLDRAEPELRGGGIRCVRVGGLPPGGEAGGLTGRALMAQVLGLANPDALTDTDLRAGVTTLTEPGEGCSRVALLVAEAQALLPSALRIIQFACRASPKLLVVLAGQPGLFATLAVEEFAYLRQRITRKLELPDPAAGSPATVLATTPELLPSPPTPRLWGGTRTLAKLGVAAVLALAVWTTRWGDTAAPRRVGVSAEASAPGGSAGPARAEREARDTAPAQADALVVWTTPRGDLPAPPTVPAPPAPFPAPAVAPVLNGRVAPTPPEPRLSAAAQSAEVRAGEEAVQAGPQPTEPVPGATADALGAAVGAPGALPNAPGSALDAVPDARRAATDAPSPHEPAVAAQVPQPPADLTPVPVQPTPTPPEPAVAGHEGPGATRERVARTDAPEQTGMADHAAPAIAGLLGELETAHAPVPGASAPDGVDDGPPAPTIQGAVPETAVPALAEPAERAAPLPPPPPPAPARTVTASAATLPEAARRPRGGADRIATPAAAPPTVPTDERRCRNIVMKAQLGEDPSDADKQFLRSGCRVR